MNTLVTNLGREDDAVALLPVVGEVLADDDLGMALGVPVGGVDEVAAARDVRARAEITEVPPFRSHEEAGPS